MHVHVVHHPDAGGGSTAAARSGRNVRDAPMRTLLSATAATALMTGAALAQGSAFVPVTIEDGVDYTASDLMGTRIYAVEREFEMGTPVPAGTATEWDDIGEIGDFVIGVDGTLDAVILDIGGFLGIGERNVAVQWSSLQPVVEDDDPNDVFLVVNASQAMLEGAPEVERIAQPVNMATDTGATMTGDETAVMAEGTEVVEVPAEVVEAEKVEEVPAETAEVVEAEPVEEAEIVTQTVEVDSEPEVVDDEVVEAEEAEVVEEGALAVVEEPTPDPAATRLADERPLLRTPAFEREGYETVMMDDFTSEEMTGMRLYGADDEDIGEIKDLIMADDGQSIERVVLDIGGFLGLGEHQVAVTLDELQIMRDPEGLNRAYIDATQEELEAQPQYEPAL